MDPLTSERKGNRVQEPEEAREPGGPAPQPSPGGSPRASGPPAGLPEGERQVQEQSQGS